VQASIANPVAMVLRGMISLGRNEMKVSAGNEEQ
jgi:hypothetical protein